MILERRRSGDYYLAEILRPTNSESEPFTVVGGYERTTFDDAKYIALHALRTLQFVTLAYVYKMTDIGAVDDPYFASLGYHEFEGYEHEIWEASTDEDGTIDECERGAK